MRGFLIPTETSLRFVQGGGKDNKKKLDLEYNKIKEISWDSNRHLSISLKKTGKKKIIEPIDSSFELLEKILRTVVEKKPSVDDYCASDHHVKVEREN